MPDKVQQATRRGHKHIYTTDQAVLLRSIPYTAKDAGGRNSRKLGVLLKAIRYLDGQLTGGEQNQSPAGLGRTEFSRIQKELQYRQGECRRLSRSRLGDSQQVLALEQAGDRLFLDGSGLFVAYGTDRTLQGVCQGEFRKKHKDRGCGM